MPLSGVREHENTHVSGGPDEIDNALDLTAIPEHGAAKHTDVTREIFLPANAGNIGAGATGATQDFPVVSGGANADEPIVSFGLKVPDDFVSFGSVKAVWVSAASSGNILWRIDATYGASGETNNTHVEEPAEGTTATGGAYTMNVQEPANALALSPLAVGDYLGLEFKREGTNGSDTLDNTMYLLGLLFTYTAHQ